MDFFKSAIVMLTLVTVAGVANSQEIPVITLKRTWCLGTCPIYSVEIFQDGRLHYHGEKFVAVTGSQEAEISPAAVETLVGSFLKIGYFDLKDAYETYQNTDGTSTMVSDLPTTYTSLRVGSRTKSVKDYAFSPEQLRTLELEIDRTANTHRWIHGSDDLKDWEMVGPDVYERIKPGMTVFMQAAGLGQTDVLQNEHDGGADIDARDETGWTALMLAAARCQENTARQLLAWHAKVTLRDEHGDDALMGITSAFCLGSREQQVAIIKMLIANGVNVNAHDDVGLTPLMALTTYGNMQAVKTLLDAGAQVDAKDNNGMTALDHARNALTKYYDHSWTDELRQLVTFLEQRSAA
jgi:hypothetical protein